MTDQPHWFSQREKDQYRNTKTRSLKKTGDTIARHISIPKDVWARVEEVQAQFKAEHGMSLSVSAAVASLITNAPQFPAG